ncbi:MAG: FtsW/RodA/SpoVE family cell cycle protein [Clostridium sp.]
MRRIIAWLNRRQMQIRTAISFTGLYAIGSGGFFGKGLGNSTQKLHAIRRHRMI